MKKALFALPLLVFLAGCGEVQFPESVSTPTPSVATTPQVVTDPNASPTASPLVSGSTLSCSAVQKERDNLAEAIKISQEELRTCKSENAALNAQKSNAAAALVQSSKFAPILKKYLAETPQKEYPFTICGGLGKATGQSWYKNFTTTLATSNIIFTPTKATLAPDDLGGVCASPEGKIAIFLGASNGGKSEFHLLKYSFETNVIEEAILINGGCGTTCPNKFGKRNGAILTLLGKGKTYNYYYDSNLITEQ